MPLPRYLLADFDPTAGESMEAWARELAAQGWRQWAGPGCWVTINGRRLWRVSLRRDATEPRRLAGTGRTAEGPGPGQDHAGQGDRTADTTASQ